MNNIVSALRFFFTHTADRPDLTRTLVATTPLRMIILTSPVIGVGF